MSKSINQKWREGGRERRMEDRDSGCWVYAMQGIEFCRISIGCTDRIDPFI